MDRVRAEGARPQVSGPPPQIQSRRAADARLACMAKSSQDRQHTINITSQNEHTHDAYTIHIILYAYIVCATSCVCSVSLVSRRVAVPWRGCAVWVGAGGRTDVGVGVFVYFTYITIMDTRKSRHADGKNETTK